MSSTDLAPVGPYISKPRSTDFNSRASSLTSTNVLPLERKQSKAGSRLLRTIRATNATCVDGTYGISDLSTAEEGQILITTVQVGNSSYNAVVDTGSSDTWFIEAGFSCYNEYGLNETESYCEFGPTFDDAASLVPIADENFEIGYADGETLSGGLAYATVTLAGITVHNQTIGVVDDATWYGDGVSSGLIGLAYAALTSAFEGTNVTADSRSTQVEYNPIFTNMYTQGSVESLFTLMLERDGGNSTLTLGGLPPAQPGYEDVSWTTVDIETMELNPASNPEFASQKSYYTIIPDGFEYRNASHVNGILTERETLNTTYPTIVDSGTSLIYLPQAQVLYINAAFSPSATYDEDSGYDVVPCNASVPEVAVVIGGTAFSINANDMLLDLGLGDSKCVSGVQNSGGAVNILGDVFLRNVFAVFDVGASQMHFAEHSTY